MARRKIHLFLIIGATLLLFFNNCSDLPLFGSASNHLPSKTSASNGEGYSGMRSYASYDFDQNCSSSNNNFFSIVSIIDGQPYLTRDNCKDITPIALPPEIISQHNQSIALYNYRLYDRIDTQASEVFCRGDRIDQMTGNREVGDIKIRELNGRYLGDVSIGVYKNNVLIKSENSKDFEFEKFVDTNPDGMQVVHYGPKYDTEEPFFVSVRKDANDGRLYGMVGAPRMDDVPSTPPPPPGSNEPLPIPPGGDQILHIEKMDCYMHSEFPGKI